MRKVHHRLPAWGWHLFLIMAAQLSWSERAAAAPPHPEMVRAAGMVPYPVPLKGPAFRLPERGGTARSKAEYHGRVVLLNFWGSWCPPCREEFPSLERLQAAVGGDGFSVLAVTVSDDPAGVERFLGGRAVPFDILIDTGRSTASAYRAAGVPVTYLLDRKGRLLAGKTGPKAWDDPAVVRLIRAVMEDE